MELLSRSFGGNSLLTWAVAAALASVSVAVLVVVRRVLARRLAAWAERTKTRTDDILVAAFERTHGAFLAALGGWIGSRTLELGPPTRRVLDALAIAALAIQGAVWGQAVLEAWVARRSTGDPSGASSIRRLGWFAKTAVWTLALLLLLENVGIDVSALVTGLGIGGIAIALAAQNVLGDLFASLSILLDKPFVAGDFIVVGDCMGVVERIGLKTTRVRSLSGEQLVFANGDLLQSRIRNYK